MNTATSPTPKNILSLSNWQKRQFLDSFDNIFSDIDGVVWNIEGNIEGAVDGYNALKALGKNIKYITNNSVRPAEIIVKNFNALGLETNVNDIIHPAQSIVDYLKSIQFDGLIYIIATQNFKKVLRDAGYKLIDGPTNVYNDTYRELVKDVLDQEPVRAVVIDMDMNLSLNKLMKAHLYLSNPECLMIAGVTDMLLPLSKGINLIGPGQFVKLLQEVSHSKMIILGKPSRDLADMLFKRFSIKNRRRCLMIGDTLEQDISFGKQCGFQTLLVLSGTCSRDSFEAATEPRLMPDYYAESMADFVQFMKELN